MTGAVASRRAAGRPARISRERILEAVASSENVETVTMRELASRLRVTHGALYRWVADRHALFELISEVLLGRVLDEDGPLPTPPSVALGALAFRLRSQYLSVPGFATHLARPHTHHTAAIERLQAVVEAAFLVEGASPGAAEQSWQAYITAVVAWIALEDRPDAVASEGQFERFVAALLRGLPVTD